MMTAQDNFSPSTVRTNHFLVELCLVEIRLDSSAQSAGHPVPGTMGASLPTTQDLGLLHSSQNRLTLGPEDALGETRQSDLAGCLSLARQRQPVVSSHVLSHSVVLCRATLPLVNESCLSLEP